MMMVKKGMKYIDIIKSMKEELRMKKLEYKV